LLFTECMNGSVSRTESIFNNMLVFLLKRKRFIISGLEFHLSDFPIIDKGI
jgi:hypothetical protein